MAIEIPKIEERGFDDLLREFKALVPFYTPEWRLELNGKGPDIAVVKIFIHLLRTLYRRVNRLPEKHFIAFLDRIGTKLIPAQPSLVPVTFLLSEGAGEHVLVPEKTQVAAGDVIFETEKNLLAAPARLVDIYSIDGPGDAIFQSPPNIISGEPVLPVETRLLYPAGLGDRDIFIESTEALLEGDHLRIGESRETTEYGIVSAVSENRLTLVQPLEKGEPVYMKIPPIEIHGVGETFSDRLKKEGIHTLKQLLQYTGKTKELAGILQKEGTRSFEYYLEQAKNILENAEKCVLDHTPPGSISPLSAVYHEAGVPVEKMTGLKLFEGKNLQEHILYLGHEELFNLDGDALIILRVTIPPLAADQVSPGDFRWEYWGEAVELRAEGEEENPGWHFLEIRPESPADEFHLRKYFSGEIAEYELNGSTSRWIRCRVLDIDKTRDIELKEISVRVVDIRYLELPTEAIRGIENTFSKRLGDNGIYTVGQLLEYKDRVFDVAEMISSKEKSIDYYKKIAENFLLNTEKHLLDEEYEHRLVNNELPSQLLPDMVFFNDLVYDLTPTEDLYLASPIYPFGKIPLLESAFYISCRELFSRPNITIHIHFELSSTGQPGDRGVVLYWEYWDGEMWNIFKNLVDNTGSFSQNGEVIFTNPGDVTSMNVNGKENFWVRARIVSGDYGREELVKDNSDIYKLDFSKIKPPVITKLTLSSTYSFVPEFFAFKHYLVSNNLELSDRYKEFRDPAKVFKPFIPLEEEKRCLYLAFDQKLEKGPVALFFAIEEKPVSPDQVPIIRWEYYSEKQQWESLDGLDTTMSLTRTGVMEFVFPAGFRETGKFGRSAYWLRAVYEDKTASGSGDIAIPTIIGVFLNTTWALQCETFRDEIVGSGDGTPGQVFSLENVPVVSGSQEIWIDEFKTISTEEQTRLQEEEIYPVNPVTDDKGNLTGFWVRWSSIEGIVNASAADRCYEIDNVAGTVTFGDGIYGKIPPTGADNIKANYRRGGGKGGNLSAFLVKDLKTSLPFLDSAFNPLAAGGGTDTETIERLMKRGPCLLKHRSRAVTLDDFEQLAFQAAGGIARVKCLANLDDRREPREGWVTVIVIPQTEEEKPQLSLQLKRKVEKYLQQRASYPLVDNDYLRVIGPVYAGVSVQAEVAVAAIEDVPLVEKACYAQLGEFLNPLGGGYEQGGWDFGKVPCFSDFYALLEKIEAVDHVAALSITLSIGEPGSGAVVSQYLLTPENPGDFYMPPYAVVCSGKHKINVGI
jgi:hypothetical protein